MCNPLYKDSIQSIPSASARKTVSWPQLSFQRFAGRWSQHQGSGIRLSSLPGKTWRLQSKLADWLINWLVD